MNEEEITHSYDDPSFMHSREARIIRIMSEYLEPEKRLRDMNVHHTVVFFGGARITPEKKYGTRMVKYYQAASDFAFALANLNNEIEKETGARFYICTGGGPGIMEAANMGAARAGSRSIGLNIGLPMEQEPNKYISPELSFKFHYFFMRKLWFLYYAKAIIVYPGGFGTMDELFETLTMVQTRKMEKLNIPILLYDKEFWTGIINFEKLIDYGFIAPEDINLFHFFSGTNEGLAILRPKLIEIIKNVRFYFNMKFPVTPSM
jgi:uncharacterized protein (TIGR00730 family)